MQRSRTGPNLPTTVEAVVFDVGGIFVLPHHDLVTEAFGAAGIDVDPDRIDEAHYHGVHAVDVSTHHEEPHYWVDYQRAYVRVLGPDEQASPEALAAMGSLFERRGELWTRVLRRSVEILHDLVAAGVPVAIVSNADGTVERLLRDEGVCQVGEGSGACVRAVVDSTVVGYEKPDPRVFEPAVRSLGIPRDRICYVGDTVRFDVAGAQAAGLTPLLYDPHRLRPRDAHPAIDDLGQLLGLFGV